MITISAYLLGQNASIALRIVSIPKGAYEPSQNALAFLRFIQIRTLLVTLIIIEKLISISAFQAFVLCLLALCACHITCFTFAFLIIVHKDVIFNFWVMPNNIFITRS